MNDMNKLEAQIEHDNKPAGGRGAVYASIAAFAQQHIPFKLLPSFHYANKPGGFDCPGCAFPDKNAGIGPDSCEQGQKAIAWEMTRKAADANFFAHHSLTELRQWSDHDLENQGRLTDPLRYDAAQDRYLPIEWSQAFALIAEQLKQLPAVTQAWYASGRSSNEAAFMWQLLARSLGCNNLPDSSNLCHEPSGYALKAQLGIGKGSCTLDDFAHADLIMVIGQNPASHHPRMMAVLHEAVTRGATVIALNPLQERGFTNFSDPKNIGEMLSNRGIKIAQRVYQVKIGGDLAALTGIAKALFEAEQNAQALGLATLLDHDFIVEHCLGFDELHAHLTMQDWPLLEVESGLTRADMIDIAALYARSKATMATWCMGITHHENSVDTVHAIVNLLMLKGNIGKAGAGVVPVRGHSNVQGDRTMGATGKVPELFLQNLEQQFGLKLARVAGKDAIDTLQDAQNGKLKALLTLGGNLGVAAPDSPRLLTAFSQLPLTVHIATKLNRTHCYPGQIGLLLPCLGRTDKDVQASGEQFITVEDSMSMVHRSCGIQTPLSSAMRSEPAILAGIGAALQLNNRIDWRAFNNDYDTIRAAIETSVQGVHHGFENFNQRIMQPGGFRVTVWSALRKWQTASGKAELIIVAVPTDTPIHRARAKHGAQLLTLMTIRSHDQFNTTIYGHDDRYRGVFGGRHVLFMHADDIAARGFKDGDIVDMRSYGDDDVMREVCGFRIVAFDIARGCAAAYFPEATPLMPLGLFAKHTQTPASKAIPINIFPARSALLTPCLPQSLP